MKKWNFALLFIAFVLCVKGQDSVSRSDGHTIFYYPTGEKSSEGLLVDGKPDGWWKSYYRNGQLASEGNRKNFLLDSIWTFYLENGRKQMTLTYRQGLKNGEQVIYAPDEYSVTVWHNDTILGSVNTYATAGWLKSSIPYEEGRAHGLAKEYDSTGLVIAVTRYRHGIMSRKERINRTDNFGYKQGNWKYFWNNGLLKMEGSYLNDKKNGFFKYYNEDGNFLYAEKYEHDRLIEDAKETKQMEQRVAYFANGKPSIIATYYKDKPDGIRRDYDTAGHIIKGYVFEEGWLRFEGITDNDGLRQGLWKEYYPTGELRSQGNYKNSHPIDHWNFYFRDSSVELTGSYNNKGEKIGKWLWFYPNGDTMIDASYDDGDLDGPYAEYDEYGKPLIQGNYVAGYEEGTWYYCNRGVVEQGKYDGGKRTGLWKTLYANGNPANEIHYDNDLRDGKYTAYWENGYIKTTGKYKKDLQDGPWMQYDEEGTLFLTTIFKDGKEIKWNNYTIK